MPKPLYPDVVRREGTVREISVDRLALLMLAIAVAFLALGFFGLLTGLSNAGISVATGGFYLAMYIFYRAFRKRGL
jgi:hypothetical protein